MWKTAELAPEVLARVRQRCISTNSIGRLELGVGISARGRALSCGLVGLAGEAKANIENIRTVMGMDLVPDASCLRSKYNGRSVRD